MQSLRWYRDRLLSMSPAEVAWRVTGIARDARDRILHPLHRRGLFVPRLRRASLGAGGSQEAWRSTSFGPHLLRTPPPAAGYPQAWSKKLLAEADALLEHRIRLLGDEEISLGEEIDWNYEYKAGKKTPMGFSWDIDYRDHNVVGDCKWIWELNRHHHLVTLGRAYRVTGDMKYAREAVAQIDAWIKQCPFSVGMNWRSPLELAIRLINWVWTIELLRPSGKIPTDFAQRIERAAYQQLWEITRKYSRHSSANNHLIGEAAGVFIASLYFHRLYGAGEMKVRSRDILLREIIAQTYDDGGHREMAVGYHHFVLQFLLIAAICSRNVGEDFPPKFWARLEKMFEFSAALVEGGDRPPMLGDCDDGYVLNLGGRQDIRGWLAVAAVLFKRPDFAVVAGTFSEQAWWILGPEGEKQFDMLQSSATGSKRLQSKAFPSSGIYLLQCGSRGKRDTSVSVSFDCGELGFKSIAAHGHADALSLTLRAFGVDFLVDPGTYDYFTYPPWRQYFRSTRAHNAVEVDGRDQSEMKGLFLWGSRARSKCVRWEMAEGRTTVTGEHDGYRSLEDPVTHRRKITLNESDKQILIEDEVIGRGAHRAAVFFHTAETCEVERIENNRFEVSRSEGQIVIEIDPRLHVEEVHGQDESAGILGWVSRSYHHKTPTTTLIGNCEFTGAIQLRTIISFHITP